MTKDLVISPLPGSSPDTVATVPPGPTGLSLFWSKLETPFNSLGVFMKSAKTYGDIVRLKSDLYLINHPDYIEQVLVNTNGIFEIDIYEDIKKIVDRVWGQGLFINNTESWQYRRRLIQSAFHHKFIARYTEIMTDCLARRLGAWQDNQILDLRQAMMRLTLEMMVKVVLGLDDSDKLDEIEAAIQATLRLLDNPAQIDVAIPTSDKKCFHERMDRLDEILYDLIKDCRRSGQDAGDVLSKLATAQDKEGHFLSDRRVRDELVTMLRSSYKNTPTTLVWTWYLLAQHPEVETKLMSEIDQVLGQRPPSFADLRHLPYTEMVIKESLRLYPLYPNLVRIAVQNCQIGGYFVPAGTEILICPWIIQRDSRYYDHPERFKPERWADDLEKRLPNFVYLPFGGGPRLCVVKGYAMLEAFLLITMIGQRFRLRPTSPRKVKPFPFFSGLRPKKNVQFRLSRR